ncbi:MAG: hypothetical protein IKC64_03330 [Clostridia bacterium]|nr:hypothetical protein [Clostridia bacterium]
MDNFAKTLVKLRLATRKVCMCEADEKQKKNTLSLKTKVLFLIGEGYDTAQIISTLLIAKTNLALLTKQLADGGFIEKTKNDDDHRKLLYFLTQRGKAYLDERISVIASNASSFTDEERAIIEKAVALLGI